MKIAITGSIGSGKSQCAAYLRSIGVRVYDTDLMVHQYYLPNGPAYDQLIETFGRSIIGKDGIIDREVLGALVFQDPALLKALEDVVYPHLKHEIMSMPDQGQLIFYEVPVLYESGFEIYFDRTLMIDVDPELAFQRLLLRGMSPDDIKRRLKHQMSPQEKRKRSDFVIENNGSIEDLHQEIKLFMTYLEKEIAHDTL